MQAGEPLDAVVIGAGPGGLTAAIYLARFHRRFVVLDGGDSRAAWIALSHNLPGFPRGLAGKVLLARLRIQARRFGAPLRKGRAEHLAVRDGLFEIGLKRGRLRARTVLLATGVVDKEPKLPDLERAIADGLIRICPICDGYEVSGRKLGVIGESAHGASEALFMRTYSAEVSLIHVGEPGTLPDADRLRLAEAGVPVIETPIQAVHREGGRIAAFSLADDSLHRFDALYSALGSSPQSGLAEQVGAALDGQGRLVVDDHQNTSVEGLYAAGDLVRGLNQITVAEAEAAIAATHIHNRLRPAGLQPAG